jgi:hypothetical protein
MDENELFKIKYYNKLGFAADTQFASYPGESRGTHARDKEDIKKRKAKED